MAKIFFLVCGINRLAADDSGIHLWSRREYRMVVQYATLRNRWVGFPKKMEKILAIPLATCFIIGSLVGNKEDENPYGETA